MDLKTRLSRLEQTMAQQEKQKTAEVWDEACICFPANEPPAFYWLAEVEIAAAVRGPLHGLRFHAIETPPSYIGPSGCAIQTTRRSIVPASLDCSGQSPQYSKAWRAGFPPDLWPARITFQFQPGPTQTLILRDGTEIPSGGSAGQWQPEKLEAGG